MNLKRILANARADNTTYEDVWETVTALEEARVKAKHADQHCLCRAQNGWKDWLDNYGEDK